MTNNTEASQNSILQQWLENLGFVNGNPFATTAADQERELLPRFYVDVEGYEAIKGDETVIVFAPRGGGKSALRVMLASQAAPIANESETLAVEFTDFDPLLRQRREQRQLTIEVYVSALLKAGLEAVLNALCGSIDTPKNRLEDNFARNILNERTGRISPAERAQIAGMVRAFHPRLLLSSHLLKRLQTIDPNFQPDWKEFNAATVEHRLGQALAFSSLADNVVAKLLADLNDLESPFSIIEASPREQITAFVELARSVHFSPVQFLIDRVDEYQETADNPVAQADTLEPLLANLPIMELPGVAFKFFLSQETRNVLLERPTIRPDRLTDRAVTVTWDKERLRHLLNERLSVYSDGLVPSLAHLCEEARIKLDAKTVVKLDEWIEEEMLTLAQGSPRRLLVAGQLLSQVHIDRNPDSNSRLEWDDWEKAKQELMQKMPPLLKLQNNSRLVWVGDRKITNLTPLDHRILLALAVAPHGRCTRDELAREAWQAENEEAVSNEAIDQAIRRLRSRLNDDTNPIYVISERGSGYRLRHYRLD